MVRVSILDTIDGALRDCEVSADAMRWAPEEKRQARPDAAQISLDGSRWWPVSYDCTPLITIDTSQFEAAFRQMGEVISGFMRSCVEVWDAVAPLAEALNQIRAERVSAMHREYRRRSSARQRRRR